MNDFHEGIRRTILNIHSNVYENYQIFRAAQKLASGMVSPVANMILPVPKTPNSDHRPYMIYTGDGLQQIQNLAAMGEV